EEVGEGGHISVDALDQLAGRVGFVEAEVEADHVAGQVGPQAVGGLPTEILADVGAGEAGGPLGDSGGDVGDGEPDQGTLGAAGCGAVDEAPDQLGADELQPDAAYDQGAEQGQAASVGREIGGEQ